jgi:cob(I)alamin adenosyltransferase
MKKATIYTGTGDNGTTSLIGGTRVPKDHKRVEAYGTIDELNAHLGMLLVVAGEKCPATEIERIESNLLAIGSYLATDGEASCPIAEDEIEALEGMIDTLEAELPPMHKFILPGGNEAAACANMCRTVCRRAERTIVSLSRESMIDSTILVYINRLSDYLFLLQRQLLDGKEKIWEKHCK